MRENLVQDANELGNIWVQSCFNFAKKTYKYEKGY